MYVDIDSWGHLGVTADPSLTPVQPSAGTGSCQRRLHVGGNEVEK